jgi:hypothetical protein
VLSLLVIGSTVQFPAPWAVLPVLSTALVIASFHGAEVRSLFPLTNSAARYFGDTSYTLYLWHWPVSILLLTVLPIGPWYFAVVPAVAFTLSALTYHFYEDPLRKGGWLDTSSGKARRLPTLSPSGCVAVGVVAVTVITLAVLSSWRGAMFNTLGAEHQSYAGLTRALVLKPCFGAPAMVNSQCVLRNPEVPLQPPIDNFVGDSPADPTDASQPRTPRGCFRLDDVALKACTYGYRGKDAVRIALVGDSHGASIIPALLPILTQNKWRLTTYVGISCQWVDPPRHDCVGADAIERDLLGDPYDLVLTTASRYSDSTAADYEKAWAPIAGAGSRIAVLSAVPGVSAESLACLTRVRFGADLTGDCGTPRADALAQPDTLLDAVRRVPGAQLIDLTPYYCNADRCPSVIGNVIVYRDTDGHLTATFARTLASAVELGIHRTLGH